MCINIAFKVFPSLFTVPSQNRGHVLRVSSIRISLLVLYVSRCWCDYISVFYVHTTSYYGVIWLVDININNFFSPLIRNGSKD